MQDEPTPSEEDPRIVRETTAEQAHHHVREDGLGWVMKTKQVGKPQPANPICAIRWNEDMLRLSPNVGKWHPRGVFRFKTWEEFDTWKSTYPLTQNS